MTTAMHNTCATCNYVTIYLLSVDTCTFRNRLRQLDGFRQVMKETSYGYTRELTQSMDIDGLVTLSQFLIASNQGRV